MVYAERRLKTSTCTEKGGIAKSLLRTGILGYLERRKREVLLNSLLSTGILGYLERKK